MITSLLIGLGATILAVFVSVPSYLWQGSLVYWAWNIVAPHLNAPLFSWWECVLVTAGIRALLKSRPSINIPNIEEKQKKWRG